MSYHRLSQAEIDMLLGGGSSSEDEAQLSQAEMDTIGEIGSTAISSAVASLGELLANNVAATNPRVNSVSLEQYCQETPTVCYMAGIKFEEGLHGTFYLNLQDLDSRIIVDLMFGNDGSNPPAELGDMELSALNEAMNQVVGTMMTSWSALYKKKVVAGPSSIKRYDLSQLELPEGLTLDDQMAKIVFRFEIGELSDSMLTLLMPASVAKDLVKAFEQATMPAPPPPPPQTQPAQATQPAYDSNAVAAAPMQAQQGYAMPPEGMYTSPQHMSGHEAQAVNAQTVQFQPFVQPGMTAQPGNLGLILDVPLQVTVELGRTRRQVKEVLDLGAGSIIELDKLTGDPVDILINGKPIAEGEVVIIDENFAVRITKIKNVADRLGSMQ